LIDVSNIQNCTHCFQFFFFLTYFSIFLSLQYAEASAIFNEALRIAQEKQESIGKNNFDTIKITKARNDLIYSSKLTEAGKNEDSMSLIDATIGALSEIVSNRTVPEAHEGFHKEHFGMMKEVKDEVLGQGLGALGEALFQKYEAVKNSNSSSNKEEGEGGDSVESLLDEAIGNIRKSIAILITSVDGDAEREKEVNALVELEKKYLAVKDQLVGLESDRKRESAPANKFEK
jgi:hypothetical protein